MWKETVPKLSTGTSFNDLEWFSEIFNETKHRAPHGLCATVELLVITTHYHLTVAPPSAQRSRAVVRPLSGCSQFILCLLPHSTPSHLILSHSATPHTQLGFGHCIRLFFTILICALKFLYFTHLKFADDQFTRSSVISVHLWLSNVVYQCQSITFTWPLSRQCEIPWRFAQLRILSVSHIMPVLALLSVVGVGMQQCMIRNHIFNI